LTTHFSVKAVLHVKAIKNAAPNQRDYML